jgi:hypothetical protein
LQSLKIHISVHPIRKIPDLKEEVQDFSDILEPENKAIEQRVKNSIKKEYLKIACYLLLKYLHGKNLMPCAFHNKNARY